MATDLIQSFVDQVIRLKHYDEHKRVRLIFQGRLLDNNAAAHSVHLRDQCSVHCVVSDRPRPRNEVRINIRPLEQPSAGAGTAPTGAQQPGPRRGFDRLLDMGFSQEDVSQFRELLREQRGESDLSGEEHINYEAEEQWMANSTHAIEQMRDERVSPAGSACELAFGMALGSLLGVIVLFWLWDGSLSVRVKLGIIIGVSIHLIFSFARPTTPQKTAQ
eukprot:m51a1_g863 hypothetical protein (218) ;mRNA; f:810383-811131